jgi:hypothetical protein
MRKVRHWWWRLRGLIVGICCAAAVSLVVSAFAPPPVDCHPEASEPDFTVASAPEGTSIVPITVTPATAAILRPGDLIDIVAPAEAGSLGYHAATPSPPDENSGDGAVSADSPSGPGPPLLARRALVLSHRTSDSGAPSGSDAGVSSESSSGGGLLGSSLMGSGSSPVVLVAVNESEAAGLSAASLRSAVAAILVP